MIYLVHPIDLVFQPAPLVIEAATFDDTTDPDNFQFRGETLRIKKEGFIVEEPEFVRLVSKSGVLKVESKDSFDSVKVNLVWPGGAI